MCGAACDGAGGFERGGFFVGFGEGGFERGHEVGGAGFFLSGLRLRDDGLAVGFFLDQFHDSFAVFVLVLSGVEVGGESLDKFFSHVEFAGVQFDVSRGTFDVFGGGDFIAEVHGFEADDSVRWAEGSEILLATHGELGDADLAGFLHGFHEQFVGLFGVLLGDEVIRLVEVDGVDGGEVDEVLEFDDSAGLWGDGFDFFVAEDDVFVGGDFVAFDHVFAVDFLAVVGADHLLLEADFVLVVEEVECDAFFAHGGVEFDGDVDHSEGEGAGPD